MNSIRHLQYQQCRTCYDSTNNLQLLTSFAECYGSQADAKTYVQLLLEVCDINIMEDKPLGEWPQFICSSCSKKLKLAHDFILQTRKINHILRSIADLMQTQRTADVIEKPELDIPFEIKMEKDEDVEVLQNERVFQYSPTIEPEVLKEHYSPLGYNYPDYTPCPNYAFKENINSGIMESDSENIKDIIVPNTIEFINNDAVIRDEPNKFSGDNVKSNNPHNTVCTECNKRFSNIWNLKRHKLTHSAKGKERSCPNCNQEFSKSATMKLHMQTVHQVKTRKPKQSRTKLTHKKKKKVHNEMINFTCNECQKVFNSHGKLSRHKRFVHISEEKKIPCLICGHKFRRVDNFKRHMETVHRAHNISSQKNVLDIKESRFFCDKCDRGYTLRSRLCRHEREVHGQ